MTDLPSWQRALLAGLVFLLILALAACADELERWFNELIDQIAQGIALAAPSPARRKRKR